MRRELSKTKATLAFSLVEMLSVIVVIGIIAAIAVPNISQVNEASAQAKDRRNAQNIASVIAAAQSAGLNFVDQGGGDLANAVAAASTGDVVSGGVFDGAFFGLGLSEADQLAALPYLRLEDDSVLYEGAFEGIEPSSVFTPEPPLISIVDTDGSPAYTAPSLSASIDENGVITYFVNGVAMNEAQFSAWVEENG